MGTSYDPRAQAQFRPPSFPKTRQQRDKLRKILRKTVIFQGLDTEGEEPSKVDCKASRAALVDHSISQRLEEERKAEERKAERTNFSNGF